MGEDCKTFTSVFEGLKEAFFLTSFLQTIYADDSHVHYFDGL